MDPIPIPVLQRGFPNTFSLSPSVGAFKSILYDVRKSSDTFAYPYELLYIWPSVVCVGGGGMSGNLPVCDVYRTDKWLMGISNSSIKIRRSIREVAHN